jgi:hypothetical protein
MEELESTREMSERIGECTRDYIDDLEYQISVGVAEAAKWTDYTYQTMQFIRERSNRDVSFQDINKHFPYLKANDCSLIDNTEEYAS